MRYFLEVAYKGTNYAGFQIQRNARTIQSVVEEALFTFYRVHFNLTGSSRTDAGVHALQNYFHVDAAVEITPTHLYNINAILPVDIVLKSAQQVSDTAHSRFDAISRQYQYFIHTGKDPFSRDTSWYYPYPINFAMLQSAAELVLHQHDFESFSKKNVQVNNYQCAIIQSSWEINDQQLIYTVTANRFLRGMVKALVATMLKVGSGKLPLSGFQSIFDGEQYKLVDFSAPSHGLFLVQVAY